MMMRNNSMSQQKNICNQKKAICYSLLNHCANIIEKFVGIVQKAFQKVDIWQDYQLTALHIIFYGRFLQVGVLLFFILNIYNNSPVHGQCRNTLVG